MATYNFSALSSGQAISFNPGSDVLNFDQTAISAGNLQVALQGSDTHILVLSGTDAGKSITLLGTMPPQLATSNVHFANGSALLFGDNSPSTAGDDANNVIPGTNGADLIMGFGGNDVIAGGEGNDSIVGGTGNDTIYGDGGNDWIEGGAGNDLLDGSGDQDSIVFREFGAANADTVSGFASDWDKIQLDAAAFTAIGASGRFTANDARFYAAPGATAGHDADDRIIYNTTTGQLFYDADGNGPGTAQLIATLSSAPPLVATDINAFGTATPPPPPPGTINGTSGNDSLVGTSGNDTINGFDGNDTLLGQAGNDVLNGGAGDDSLDGGPGDDAMNGGEGNDTYVVDSGNDVLVDSGGVDTVILYVRGATLPDGFENLTLRGGPFVSAVGPSSSGVGNSLHNLIVDDGRGGAELIGGGGDDTLMGLSSDYFSFSGDYGHDIVDGAGGGTIDFQSAQNPVIVNFSTGTLSGNGTGSATLQNMAHGTAIGGSANDLLVAGGSGNTLLGGSGDDTLVGGTGDDTLRGDGGLGDGSGTGNDSISGSGGNDFIDGGPGNDTLDGGAGNDTFSFLLFNTGSYGNDTVTGGDGIDLIDIANLTTVNVNLATGVLTGGEGGGGGRISFSGIENFSAHGAASMIIGDAGANVLRGAGNNDTIDGGAGNDTLTGFAGADQFIFDQTGAANADLITDFTSGSDQIHLDARVMSALGTTGAFATGDARFYAASGATGGHDADDRVVYDATTGNLWYDADGSGAGSAQLIATLQGAPALTATDIVVDNGSPPTINGTAGNDSLVGTPANDTINGFDGNDTIDGGAGDDSMSGGNGDDSLIGGDGNDTISGGAGSDTLSGLGGDDSLSGGDGNDVLDGRPGIDTLDGGVGDDFYFVDSPGDVVVDAGGNDTVFAGMSPYTLPDSIETLFFFGNASVNGIGNALANNMNAGSDASSAMLSGLAGNDTLAGTNGNDTLLGGDGNDLLSAYQGTNLLNGGAGNDTLVGMAGDGKDTFVFDQAPGTANADVIQSFQPGGDTIQLDATVMAALGASGRFSSGDPRFYQASGATSGHDADDRIIADLSTGNLYYDADGNGPGASQLIATVSTPFGINASDITVVNGTSTGLVINGTAGDDQLSGTPGDDTISGLGGNDTLDGAGGNDVVHGGDGNDMLSATGGNDLITGDAGDDIFVGGLTSGADTMLGGDGNDIFREIGANGDSIDGGAGVDTLEIITNAITTGVVIDLAAGTISGPIGNATIANVENAKGSFRADSITGDGNANLLSGGDGNDTIIGGAGNDTLSGDAGNDSLAGGAGSDAFYFGPVGSATADSIADFTSGVDVIHLDASGLADLGTSGQFAAGDPRFYAAAGATGGHDADDRLVYNTSTGQLFYDPDGNGSQAAQLVATLQSGATLVATDLFVDHGSTSGNDVLIGSEGPDTINGLGGDDTLIGGGGNDRLDGGDGNDQVDGGAGDDLEIGGAGNDIVGSSDWSHSLYADADPGNDTLDGGLGNDTFFAQSTDTLVDAGGLDTVMVQGISWTLAPGFENLQFYNHFNDNGYKGLSGTGNELDNTINALQGADGIVARGLGGNDLLVGTFYSDTLDGGLGNDTLIGFGGGSDTYVFNVAPGAANADTVGGSISDPPASGNFVPGVDKIELDGNAYTNIGASGNFATNDARFYAAAGANAGHDADDRVVYDTITGQLWYDADGNGGGAAQLIATFQGAPALSATDIEVINGAPSGQMINGTAGNDTLVGGAGNDTINGLAGNDTIDGGAGADSMVGGPGDDLYFVDNPSDIIVEQNLEGFDEVRSTASSYTLSDWINNLTLLPGAGNGTGNAIDNVITGNGASNALSGGDGNDTLIGAGGNDTFTGGNGADAYVFNAIPGTANAGLITDFASATDVIRLDGRAMTAIGASGTFASGDARFYAAAGANGGHDADDRVVYNITTGQLWYDADGSGSGAAQLIATLQGAPTLAATDIAVDNGTSAPPPPPPGSIIGTAGNDTMPGTAGNDSMFGLGGNDVMAGGGGADSIVGGAGNDTIYGDYGNDWIEGGAGNDSLSGGGDQDSYVFREYGAANADTVGDFASAWDMLRFDGSAFSALGGAGHFAAGDARFYAAAGASGGHDADDRLVYNTTTGQLFYDADGSGGGAAQLVATIQGAPGVAAGDIWVI